MGQEIAKVLTVAWIASIFPILLASIASRLGLASLHRLILAFANRGKTVNASKKFTVPQRLFLHFYVVAVLWTTLLLLATWVYAYNMVPLSAESLHDSTLAKSHSVVEGKCIVWRSVLLLLLMEVQVWRRLYESLYVFNYSPSARMHIVGYFTGLFYYAVAPLSLCNCCAAEAVKFSTRHVAEFIVEGRYKMPYFEFDWFGYTSPLTKIEWFQWIGVAIFLWGWIHQRRCHAILGSLREQKGQRDKYVIPCGDWFEIVSCPHYLAEIVIYAGILIVSGGLDLTIWLLFGFVVVNLVFASAEIQRWYLSKFDNYPQSRKAILPLLY